MHLSAFGDFLILKECSCYCIHFPVMQLDRFLIVQKQGEFFTSEYPSEIASSYSGCVINHILVLCQGFIKYVAY